MTKMRLGSAPLEAGGVAPGPGDRGRRLAHLLLEPYLGHQREVRREAIGAGRDEMLGDEAHLVLVAGLPGAAMDEDQDRAAGFVGDEDIEQLVLARPVGDVAQPAQLGAHARAFGDLALLVPFGMGHQALLIILRVELGLAVAAIERACPRCVYPASASPVFWEA